MCDGLLKISTRTSNLLVQNTRSLFCERKELCLTLTRQMHLHALLLFVDAARASTLDVPEAVHFAVCASIV